MKQLTNCIVAYIFDNLGITLKNKFSVISDSYLISEKIYFEDDQNNGNIDLYGIQISLDKIKFRILCGNFINDEYYLVIKLDNCPIYGLFLDTCCSPYNGDIFFSLSENNWLFSNIYIQAMFLAGMEQLKDFSATWTPLSKYDDLIINMKSLIEFHDNCEEGSNEG